MTWCRQLHHHPFSVPSFLLLLQVLVESWRLLVPSAIQSSHLGFPVASAQLSLWADRSLLMHIIESLPTKGKSLTHPRCPRRRPDLQKQIPPQLFLVLNGLLVPEVYEHILHGVHNPIPPQIEIIRVKWKAGLERLSYNISVTSLNRTLLHNPLLNVAFSGQIPAMESDVQITLACTGKLSGFASFELRLDIRREFEALRKIPHLEFVAQKYCLTYKQSKWFQIKCYCRAHCQQLAARGRLKMSRKKCNRQCRHYVRLHT
uniref:Protein shifted n=1 Tax=Schistocephalus solidus TaxID=70667 RepID=A0A0X3P8F5_SCHSO